MFKQELSYPKDILVNFFELILSSFILNWCHKGFLNFFVNFINKLLKHRLITILKVLIAIGNQNNSQYPPFKCFKVIDSPGLKYLLT